MKYFQTDESGFLVGNVQGNNAIVSPVQPEILDEFGAVVSPAVYLIPRGGVEAVPPVAGANQAAQFVAGAWQLVADFRGVAYWDDAGASHIVTERGSVPPVGAHDAPPALSLNVWNGSAFVPRVLTLAEVQAREVGEIEAVAERKLDRIESPLRRAVVKLIEGGAVSPALLARIKKNDLIEGARDAAILAVNAATTKTAAKAVKPAIVWP